MKAVYFALLGLCIPVVGCSSGPQEHPSRSSQQADSRGASPPPEGCNDFHTCPAGQTCVDSSGNPVTNGAPGTCAPTTQGSCQTPSDCVGLLPHSTKVCADGTTQNAQWDCVQNSCTISYCDNNGGPASYVPLCPDDLDLNTTPSGPDSSDAVQCPTGWAKCKYFQQADVCSDPTNCYACMPD